MYVLQKYFSSRDVFEEVETDRDRVEAIEEEAISKVIRFVET